MRPMIVMLVPLGEAPTAPGGPVDPGWGVSGPVDPGYGRPGIGAGHPGNALPIPPVDPSWGVQGPPVDPGYGRPEGGRPGHDLPGAPGHPSQLPTRPGPDNTLPLPPNNPAQPGQIYPPITELHTKTAVLAWLPGYGYRWIVLGPQGPGAGQPARPTQPLPPTAQPKT